MADLPHTICFRASTMTYETLRAMADANNRRLGDMVRILVEQKISEQVGKVSRQ